MSAEQPKKYWVYYELNEYGCEPELMGKTGTLAEAWAMVRDAFLSAHETCPEDCRHPDAIPRYKTRKSMPKGTEDAFFEIPEESSVSAEKPTWIAVGGPDTYFVFPGDWDEYCGEKFDQTVAALGNNVTVIRGV